VEEINETVQNLSQLEKGFEAFNNRLVVMETEEERRENILSYAAELGADFRQLKGDRKAFRRYFDEDAVASRYHSRRGEQERHLCFCLKQLGHLVASNSIASLADWKKLQIDKTTETLLSYNNDPRVPEAALECLATSISNFLQSSPPVKPLPVLDCTITPTVAMIYLCENASYL